MPCRVNVAVVHACSRRLLTSTSTCDHQRAIGPRPPGVLPPWVEQGNWPSLSTSRGPRLNRAPWRSSLNPTHFTEIVAPTPASCPCLAVSGSHTNPTHVIGLVGRKQRPQLGGTVPGAPPRGCRRPLRPSTGSAGRRRPGQSPHRPPPAATAGSLPAFPGSAPATTSPPASQVRHRCRYAPAQRCRSRTRRCAGNPWVKLQSSTPLGRTTDRSARYDPAVPSKEVDAGW